MKSCTLPIGIALAILALQGCGDNAEQSRQPVDPNTTDTTTPTN